MTFLFTFYILIFDFPLQSLIPSPLSLTPNPQSLTPRLSTTVESALQIKLFMQNEPNFRKSQMNVNKVLTTDYEKRTLGQLGKTNPIRTQYEPNQSQYKPNSNPKQTQTKPIFVPLVLFIVYNCL